MFYSLIKSPPGSCGIILLSDVSKDFTPTEQPMPRFFCTPELGLLTPKFQEHGTTVSTLSRISWPLQSLRAEVGRIGRKTSSLLQGDGGEQIKDTTKPDSSQQGYQSCIKTILNSLVAYPFRFILLPQYHILFTAH